MRAEYSGWFKANGCQTRKDDMNLDDTTAIKITRVSRSSGRLVVQMQLSDAVTGADKGAIEESWEEATELPEFLAQNQTLDSLVRAVIKPTFNLGANKYLAETLTGKTFDASGKEKV